MADESKPKNFGEQLTEWERSFDKSANEMMGTEAFSAWMNLMQRGQLNDQSAFMDFMTQQREAMNAPTREDVIRLGESIRRLEKKIEDVETLLKAALPAPPAKDDRTRPTRDRQPPENLVGEAS